MPPEKQSNRSNGQSVHHHQTRNGHYKPSNEERHELRVATVQALSQQMKGKVEVNIDCT